MRKEVSCARQEESAVPQKEQTSAAEVARRMTPYQRLGPKKVLVLHLRPTSRMAPLPLFRRVSSSTARVTVGLFAKGSVFIVP